MNPAINPLNRTDLANINKALAGNQTARELIEAAKACGCDVGALDLDCKMCTDTLLAIKEKFFTTRPEDVSS